MTEIRACDRHPGHMTQSGCRAVVSVAPSPGWHVARDTAQSREVLNPLVGWGVLCNGEVVPLGAEADGSVSELSELARCVHIDPLDSVSMGLTEIAQTRR